jgi:hypothetical protein
MEPNQALSALATIGGGGRTSSATPGMRPLLVAGKTRSWVLRGHTRRRRNAATNNFAAGSAPKQSTEALLSGPTDHLRPFVHFESKTNNEFSIRARSECALPPPLTTRQRPYRCRAGSRQWLVVHAERPQCEGGISPRPTGDFGEGGRPPLGPWNYKTQDNPSATSAPWHRISSGL